LKNVKYEFALPREKKKNDKNLKKIYYNNIDRLLRRVIP